MYICTCVICTCVHKHTCTFSVPICSDIDELSSVSHSCDNDRCEKGYTTTEACQHTHPRAPPTKNAEENPNPEEYERPVPALGEARCAIENVVRDSSLQLNPSNELKLAQIENNVREIFQGDITIQATVSIQLL